MDLQRHTIYLDFYGVRAHIACDGAETTRRLRNDFAYFETDTETEAAAVSVETQQCEPDWNALPDLSVTSHTPRNHNYSHGEITYLDYAGKALGVYRRDTNHLRITSASEHLLHEISYLAILSRVGELLDKQGMHRVHALAVGRAGKSALFLMDSGGGKSTLGLAFLQQAAAYQLLSEDSPLVVRKTGGVLPFPLRMGLLPPLPEHIDPAQVSYLERMEYEPKYLVSVNAFSDRLGHGNYKPRILFIGKRRLGRGFAIHPAGYWAGFGALLRQMVVGVGIYQGLEFLLRTSALDLWRQSGTVLSRLACALRLLRHVDVYTVELGRDHERNIREIIAFLDDYGLGRKE